MLWCVKMVKSSPFAGSKSVSGLFGVSVRVGCVAIHEQKTDEDQEYRLIRIVSSCVQCTASLAVEAYM